MSWSDSEDQKLLRMRLRDSKTYRAIADDLEKSSSAVGRRAKKLGISGERGNVRLYHEMMGEEAEPHLEPVSVEMPSYTPSSPDSVDKRTLHWGDTQHPFHDERALNVLYQIAEDASPDEIYAMGDHLDNWQISDFRPPDERRLDAHQIELQDSIEQVAQHLAIVEDAAQPERKVYLEGNHEERWSRMLRDLQKNYRFRHLMQLPKLQEALSLPHLLGVEERGWEYVHEYEQPVVMHDVLTVLHGFKNNKWVTRSLLDQYGKSVMFGHTHRIQNFTRNDLKGQEAGWTIGCLCELRQHYGDPADYGQQGFAIVDWTDTNDGWLFDVQQIRVHDGTALWQGKTYSA